jgi:hypothetical protein
MRKFLLYSGFIITSVLFLSCEENLNPYGELKDRYILTCLVRGDTTFQSATLTRDYQVSDMNGYSNNTDPNIKGAVIRIWSGNDKVAILRDTTITRPEGDPYQTPYSAYYTKSFMPDSQSQLLIEAILPNGKRLTATTTTPLPIEINYSRCDLLIPSLTTDKIQIGWYSVKQNPVYIVRATIHYYKNYSDGRKVSKIYEIPQQYVQYNGGYTPVYPKPTSGGGYVTDMAAISRAMQLISEGDSDKASYEIVGCLFEILSLDQPLSTYYNSTVRGSDTFSIKLTTTDYTNIQGGYGIFGVYTKQRVVSYFRHSYLQSFGYTPGSTEGAN